MIAHANYRPGGDGVATSQKKYESLVQWGLWAVSAGAAYDAKAALAVVSGDANRTGVGTCSPRKSLARFNRTRGG